MSVKRNQRLSPDALRELSYENAVSLSRDFDFEFVPAFDWDIQSVSSSSDSEEAGGTETSLQDTPTTPVAENIEPTIPPDAITDLKAGGENTDELKNLDLLGGATTTGCQVSAGYLTLLLGLVASDIRDMARAIGLSAGVTGQLKINRASIAGAASVLVGFSAYISYVAATHRISSAASSFFITAPVEACPAFELLWATCPLNADAVACPWATSPFCQPTCSIYEDFYDTAFESKPLLPWSTILSELASSIRPTETSLINPAQSEMSLTIATKGTSDLQISENICPRVSFTMRSNSLMPVNEMVTAVTVLENDCPRVVLKKVKETSLTSYPLYRSDLTLTNNWESKVSVPTNYSRDLRPTESTMCPHVSFTVRQNSVSPFRLQKKEMTVVENMGTCPRILLKTPKNNKLIQVPKFKQDLTVVEAFENGIIVPTRYPRNMDSHETQCLQGQYKVSETGLTTANSAAFDLTPVRTSDACPRVNFTKTKERGLSTINNTQRGLSTVPRITKAVSVPTSYSKNVELMKSPSVIVDDVRSLLKKSIRKSIFSSKNLLSTLKVSHSAVPLPQSLKSSSSYTFFLNSINKYAFNALPYLEHKLGLELPAMTQGFPSAETFSPVSNPLLNFQTIHGLSSVYEAVEQIRNAAIFAFTDIEYFCRNIPSITAAQTGDWLKDTGVKIRDAWENLKKFRLQKSDDFEPICTMWGILMEMDQLFSKHSMAKKTHIYDSEICAYAVKEYCENLVASPLLAKKETGEWLAKTALKIRKSFVENAAWI